jgi:hypothetical protein
MAGAVFHRFPDVLPAFHCCYRYHCVAVVAYSTRVGGRELWEGLRGMDITEWNQNGDPLRSRKSMLQPHFYKANRFFLPPVDRHGERTILPRFRRVVAC